MSHFHAPKGLVISDLIDLTDAFVLNVTDMNNDTFVDQADIDLALAAAVTLEDGALKTNGETWFNVYTDAAGTVAAEDVVIKLDVTLDGGLTTTSQEFIL